MATIANYWAEKDNSVTLITLGPQSTDFYQLHPKVKRVALNLARVSHNPFSAMLNNLRRLKRLRGEIRRDSPDVVLSFMDTTNVLTLAATFGLRIPVIVSEHIDPRQHRISRVWESLRRLMYPYAKTVVVLTEELRGWARSFNAGEDAVCVIPNPVNDLSCHSDDGSDQLFSMRGQWAVGIGRLVPQKGFDLLLRAFAQCAARVPDWSLVILGDGEEREPLKELAAELGIAPRVSLPGRVQQPLAILKRADLFVLSSRYEGFPMVLLEAMVCGLPVISFDCPTGPREIIRNGIDGVLIEPNDVNALAVAMERLMSDEEARTRLRRRAVEVTERFSLERVMGLWDGLLHQVIGKTSA